jgi:hypothetical protein
VTKTTAHEAPGTTHTSSDDLWVDRFVPPPRRAADRQPQEAVDGAGPVDAQTRPPRLGKRRTVSHTVHRHPRICDRKEKCPADLTHGLRPANDNYRAPLRSTVGSFASPSPAEIVVANRQK